MSLTILLKRFIQRKVLLIFERSKQQLAAAAIQRLYRIHLAWVLYIKEQLRLYYENLRKNTGLMITAASIIQRNWWRFWDISRFPKHVNMLCRRLYFEGRQKSRKAADTIKQMILKFLRKKALRRRKLQNRKANKIWRLAKAYFLKLAVWDRVDATRRRLAAAANFIKWNIRRCLFRQKLWVRLKRSKFTSNSVLIQN